MAWSAEPPSKLVEIASANAAAKAAADAEATPEGEEPPPAPEPITDPLAAATTLLEDESVVGAISGADASADFEAACTALGLAAAHPEVLKGLAKGATFSLRGWRADLPSLCALLAVLSKHGSVNAAKFWSCGFDAQAIALLTSALPETIETLALEGSTLFDEASLASLASLPKVSALSLRCSELSGMPSPLAASLRTNETLTSLSLFGNPIGDEGVAALCSAMRTNTALLTLDLGRCRLTDASCESMLEMCTEEPAPPPAEEPAEPAEPAEAAEPAAEGAEDGGEEVAATPEPVPPNRTLSSLNLCYNAIHTKGRAMLEQCQELSPGLARIELVGNPCLSCGPTASLGVAARSAIAASWEALAALEEAGGQEGVIKGVVAAALAEFEEELLPIVGYEPPPTPRPELDEEGNPIAPPEGEEGEAEAGDDPKASPTSKIESWEGLAPLTAKVCKAIGGLVTKLGDPEALKAALAADYGVLLASRGVPAGAPFDKFGELLLSALQEALGAEGLSEEAAAAWRDAYADASACLQEAYTLSQLAEAASKAAAAAAAPAEEAAAAE